TREEGQLTLRAPADGSGTVGVLVSPGQDPAPMTLTSGDGTPVNITTQLSYGVLSHGSWSPQTVTPLPQTYQPSPGDSLSLGMADLDGTGAGWGALTVVGTGTNPVPLMLGQFDQSGWKFVRTGLDVLDLSGGFAQAGESVRPTGIHVS